MHKHFLFLVCRANLSFKPTSVLTFNQKLYQPVWLLLCEPRSVLISTDATIGSVRCLCEAQCQATNICKLVNIMNNWKQYRWNFAKAESRESVHKYFIFIGEEMSENTIHVSISWLPHGRGWCRRQIFKRQALPAIVIVDHVVKKLLLSITLCHRMHIMCSCYGTLNIGYNKSTICFKNQLVPIPTWIKFLIRRRVRCHSFTTADPDPCWKKTFLEWRKKGEKSIFCHGVSYRV